MYICSIKAFQSTKSLPKELMWDIGASVHILYNVYTIFIHAVYSVIIYMYNILKHILRQSCILDTILPNTYTTIHCTTDRIHMMNRLPIFSSTRVGADWYGEGEIGERIP